MAHLLISSTTPGFTTESQTSYLTNRIPVLKLSILPNSLSSCHPVSLMSWMSKLKNDAQQNETKHPTLTHLAWIQIQTLYYHTTHSPHTTYNGCNQLRPPSSTLLVASDINKAFDTPLTHPYTKDLTTLTKVVGLCAKSFTMVSPLKQLNCIMEFPKERFFLQLPLS